jgi:hypothetical protein
MPNNDDDMKLLGQLICSLNPYTEVPAAPGSKTCTGEMCVTMDPKVASARTKGGASSVTIDGIEIEVEDNYGTKWSFKGQTQTVKAAARIPYRFPVKTADGTKVLYWRTEYLLIGYAGGDGGA